MPAKFFPNAICVSFLLAACAADPGGEAINDPNEAMNRQVHAFNRGVDAHLVKPLSSGMSGGGDGGGAGAWRGSDWMGDQAAAQRRNR